VPAKFIDRKLVKKMIPENPGPGSLQQVPTFIPEFGPVIK